MSMNFIVLTILLVAISGHQALFSSAIQNANLQLDRLIDSADRCHCNSAYRGINRLGKGADGEYAEYYGYQVVNLFKKDSAGGTFVTFLLKAPQAQRNFIDWAIAAEVSIVAEKGYVAHLKNMINRYCVNINAINQRTLVARYSKLISKMQK